MVVLPDVGELFVRVRPDTTGFKSESEAGVAGAGSALGKIFVTAFAAVGVADLIKKTVEAAVQQQATFAILNKTVENAGAANEVHGQSVDTLVKQQAALKGFSVTDIAGAFTKLESVTRNSAEAFKLLNSAEDLARGTGKSLAVSALGVEKAYEGSATSLSRYGIIIPKVTTAVDQLRAAHAAQIVAGDTFNAQQNAAYAIALRTATAQDKILTGQQAIAAIQGRFGGESAAFAQTAAGEYDRLKVSVDQLAVSVGTALLPPLTTGVTDLARWADELSHSSTVSHDASIAGHDLSVVLHDVEAVAKAVGPPLGDVAKFVYEIVSAVGAPALLAAVGTFEALKLASAGWAVAQGAVNTVIAAGQPEVVAATADNAALASSELAVGAAGAEASVGLDAFGAGLLALATGPGGILLGLTAVAGGIAYLVTQESGWAAANDHLTTSTNNLVAALNAQKQATGALGQEAAAKNTAAAYAAEAANVYALAQQAVTKANTAPPTTGYSEAETIAHRERLAAITGTNVAASQNFVAALGQQAAALGKNDPLLSHNYDLIAQLSRALQNVPSQLDIKILINNQDPTAGIASALDGLAGLQTLIKKAIAPSYDFLNAPGALGGYTEAQVKAAQAAQADVTSGKTHSILTAAAQLAITQLQQGIALAQGQQQDLNAQMVDAVAQGAIAVEQSIAQAQVNFITIGTSIATDIGTYIDQPLTTAGNALQLQADRIANIQAGMVAKFAGSNALLTNETNAISVRAAALALHEKTAQVSIGGHALSKDPATALKELEQAQKTASPASQFALQQYIDQYQTAVIALKRAQNTAAAEQPVGQAQRSADIAFSQAHLKVLQDRANAEKTAATRSINDWATEWLTKKITLEQFDKDVAGLIKRDVGSLGNIAKLPGGKLLEQQLLGQIAGLKLQATALAAGPQQQGAGFLPSITIPLTALQNEHKSIASIAHSDATTHATIATDQRNILKSIYGATKNTAGLSSLAKNPPTSAQVHSALAGLGG